MIYSIKIKLHVVHFSKLFYIKIYFIDGHFKSIKSPNVDYKNCPDYLFGEPVVLLTTIRNIINIALAA